MFKRLKENKTNGIADIINNTHDSEGNADDESDNEERIYRQSNEFIERYWLDDPAKKFEVKQAGEFLDAQFKAPIIAAETALRNATTESERAKIRIKLELAERTYMVFIDGDPEDTDKRISVKKIAERLKITTEQVKTALAKIEAVLKGYGPDTYPEIHHA
jgi:hypothetical protein